nr:hypothetical protein [Mycoplasmopsis cynos]
MNSSLWSKISLWYASSVISLIEKFSSKKLVIGSSEFKSGSNLSGKYDLKLLISYFPFNS